MQILDLENNYFSVKFQKDNDYLIALIGGPWTIFKHYLIVTPYSLLFSTNQLQPRNLLVWVRLPRLLEGLYNDNLLKFIGKNVGTVAKVDRNTKKDLEDSLQD